MKKMFGLEVILTVTTGENCFGIDDTDYEQMMETEDSPEYEKIKELAEFVFGEKNMDADAIVDRFDTLRAHIYSLYPALEYEFFSDKVHPGFYNWLYDCFMAYGDALVISPLKQTVDYDEELSLGGK